MKKTAAIAIVLTALISFFCLSCEEPSVEPVTTGKLTLEPALEKELVWSANTEIAEYVYKATPLFEGGVTGKTADWQHLSFGGSGSAGELTQGKWHFELQGRNSKGTAITTGEADAYIEAGKDNIISIKVKTDPTLGTGQVLYNIWSQNVSAAGSVFKVYDKPAGSTSFTLLNTQSDVSTENPRFTGTLKNLKAGYHELLFMLFDKSGTVLGGEQLGVQIVTGESTTVSGIIEPSLEAGFELTIKSMGFVHAELYPTAGIEVSGTGRDKTAYIERDDAVTFTWKNLDDATSQPTEWIWAVDGEVIPNTGNSYTVQYDTYGEHELSVIGIRRDSSGVAWDAGSAVIRIVVVRHICEITFDANGGFFPDGTDIAVIQEDTTVEDGRKIPGGQPYDGLSPQKTGYRLTGWYDTETGKKVVEIASDGSVTFLSGFITKEETRTLKAAWDAGTYNLKIVWGENVTARKKSVAYEETFSMKSGTSLSSYLDSAPVRQGFNFLGYTTEENNRGDAVSAAGTFIWGKDTTIYANWEYIPITISYYKSYSDYQKGNTPYKTTIVGSDLRYGSLPQPLRQGKVFKGWAQPEDVNDSKIEKDSAGNTYLWQDALLAGKNYVTVTTYVKKYYNHALVAVWGEGNIKITFDIGDATLTANGKNSIGAFAQDSNGKYYKNGALGTMYGALPFTGIETSVRAGMEFMGWYDSATYNLRVYEVSSITTNNDHTLYAKWAGTKLMVSFEPGNGESLSSVEVRYNSTYGTLPEVSRTGYDFVGWTYNNEIITADSVVKVTSSHTLTAKWKEKQSTITLDTAGGTISGGTTYTVGYDKTYGTAVSGSVSFADTSTTSGLKEPTRTGYDFAGWYTNPAGVGTAVTSKTVNKNDNAQTLYATWTAHKHSITFYNNWPTTDETAGKAATSKKSDIAYGTSYGDLPLLAVTGYTFNGWYTAASGGTRVSSTTKYDVDKDISLYARWSITKITISFYEDGVICKDANGLSLQPVERTWNDTLGTVTAPYKKGYDFTGKWQVIGKTDSSGNPVYMTSSSVITNTEDITLSPVWTASFILVIVPFSAEVTENGTITAVDWTGAKTFQGTFKESLSSLKTATVSGGKWTAGSSESLPVFTRSGYWQNGWQMVISGQSKEVVDATALINDFGTMESYAVARYGAVTPDKVLYLIPNWIADTYTIEFKNVLITDGSPVETADGPYKEPVEINNGEVLSNKLGKDTDTWHGTWDGYACLGAYSDSSASTAVTADMTAGQDIQAQSGTITIYFKWQKLRTRYTIDTTSSSYVDTRNEVFSANDIFSGVSLADGWYDFTGTVNEKAYTKIRKVDDSSTDLTLIDLTGKADALVEASLTSPGTIPINIVKVSDSLWQTTEKCTVCNGAGYVGYTSFDKASGTSSANGDAASKFLIDGAGTVTTTASIHYKASYMYDFCPDGCQGWTHINSHNAKKTYGQWVTCPNCNGNYTAQRQAGWRTNIVENDWCPGHEYISDYTCPGHTRQVQDGYTCPGHKKTVYHEEEYCPGHKEIVKTWEDSEGNEQHEYETTYCSGCKSRQWTTTETEYCDGCEPNYVTESYTCDGCVAVYATKYCSGCKPSTYAYWYDNRCYCEYQSQTFGGEYKPGYIWLSGYRLFDTASNKTIDDEYKVTEFNGENLGNTGYVITPAQVYYTDTNNKKHLLIWEDIEFPYSTTLKEGETFACYLNYYVPASSEILMDLITPGRILITDVGLLFAKYLLAGAGDGTMLNLSIDHYEATGGRYLVANGNAVTTKPTPYYTYDGAVQKEKYLIDNTAKTLISSEDAESGFIAADSIDTSLGATFIAITGEATLYSGIPSAISWDENSISVTCNGTVFTWNRRADGSHAADVVCSALKLICWVKE